MMPRTLTTALLLASAALFSCVPTDTQLEGRPCPCVDGYVCNLALNTCTRFFDAGGEGTDAPGADVRQSEDAAIDQGAGDVPIGDVAMVMDGGPDGTDGGTADSGPSDVGPTDVGLDVPGPADVGVDAFDGGPPPGSFCDRHGAGSFACLDFDTNPAGWARSTTGSATINFDSDRVVNGRSMRFRVGATEAANFNREAGNVSTGTMWFRFRAFLGDGTSIDYISLFSIAQLFTPPYSYANLRLSSGAQVHAVLTRDGAFFQQIPAVTMPAGEWVCLEVQLPIGANVDMVSYLNGTEIGRVAVNSTGGWDRVFVGPDSTSATQARRALWFDDFIWSSSRVPCDRE